MAEVRINGVTSTGGFAAASTLDFKGTGCRVTSDGDFWRATAAATSSTAADTRAMHGSLMARLWGTR